ncbi:glycosyltransferase [Pseudodesulfovibrio karagichevae]|uniref:Glycosyltransferase n=1 Tax=Pseudodesulfovibrio karagichevae TaxID=3239305 RepID=A0ABV4JWS0_9BACT
MRILHISKFGHPERGGIETFVRDLSAEQARRGHEVAVLCHQARPWMPTDNSIADGVFAVRARILCNLGFAPLSPSFPLLLGRLVRESRPEFIHLHLPNPAVLFSLWLPAHIPLIIHWHADADGLPGRLARAAYPIYRLFERKSLSLARRVVTTSPPYAASSRALAQWRDKCVVVPLGIDPARYPEGAALPEVSAPLILSVGRFSYYKGYATLVEAARLVPGARFVVVGDGPLHGTIRDMVREYGLEDRVELPGELEDRDLRALQRRADVACLPSVDRAEAFGMVQLEAMRYGVPLVSTAIPGSGVDWVNRDGVTGLVVPPGDAASLAEALQRLIDHPRERAAMGEAGRRRLDAEFTIGRVATALDGVYRQAQSSPRSE